MSVHSTCCRPCRQNGSSASHRLSCRPASSRGCARAARRPHRCGCRRPGRCARRRSCPASRAPAAGCSTASAADDHARDAVAQQIIDDRGRAHAAADLQSAPRAARRGARSMLRLARVPSRAPSRSTTCSQVAPISPIALQQLVRLELVARLGGEVALEQAHAAPVAQIDGGNQQHASDAAPENCAECARRPWRSARDETACPRSCPCAPPRQCGTP